VIAHLIGVIPTHFPSISPLVEQVGKPKSLFSKPSANLLLYFDDIGQDLIKLYSNQLPYLTSLMNSNGKIPISASIQGAEVVLFSILNGVNPIYDASGTSNILKSIIQQKRTSLFFSTSADQTVASLLSPYSHSGYVFSCSLEKGFCSNDGEISIKITINELQNKFTEYGFGTHIPNGLLVNTVTFDFKEDIEALNYFAELALFRHATESLKATITQKKLIKFLLLLHILFLHLKVCGLDMEMLLPKLVQHLLF